MKKNYFWSPHIDPHVATRTSVFNSLKSLSRFEKSFECALINVFGEWDEYKFDNVQKINLVNNRSLLKKKFKGFINSRILYISVYLQSYFSLKKVLKRDKPDHLIVHLITSLPILMFLLNNFQTKLVLRISGFPKLNLPRYLLWKIASKKIKFVICPTKETMNLLLKKKIFKKEQLKYIPDPILNIKKINILKKKQLDLKIDHPYFLTIGRFTKQKNHLFLLNFFCKNPNYLEDHKLIIIGEGELEHEYKKVIKKGNLSNKVQILNYKKNIFNYIYNAKCIISVSLWEDPGFVMVESAFIGTPIVSSNCPNGPVEFLCKNKNGFIFNSNSMISLQQEIDNFLGTSKSNLVKKLIGAKKKSKLFTCFNNYKKLSKLLN